MGSYDVIASLRRRRGLALLIVVLVLAVPVSWAAMERVDRDGLRFYDSGRSVVGSLALAAAAIEAADAPGLERLLAADYRGRSLGLGAWTAIEQRDGVRRYAPTAAGDDDLDRAAALAEWRAYRAGFAAVEEASLFVHRLESWDDGDAVAQVRYELIGRPHGEARSGIDRATFRMRFRPADAGPWELVAAERLEGERSIAAEPHFADVADAAGVAFLNRYYPPFIDQPLRFRMLRFGPAGITVGDLDRDGLYDLFVPDGVASRAFRNRGDGGFDDVTAEVGLDGLDGVGVGLFADFDDDGDLDFFVSRTFQPNQLFRNDPAADGMPRFVDVTPSSGIGADCCTTVASVADVDLDGDLDLYVGRYLDPRTAIPTTFYARNGEPNQLYRNDGGLRFTNVTDEAGVGELGLCLGSVFGDYDDDGDPDLYVVNDFGRKTLYRNEGDGTFRDVTVETGTLAYGAGMSASFGDYDNDGRLDLYVAHIRSEHGWFAERPTVMRYMLNTWRQGVWTSDMPLYLEVFRQSGLEFVKVFQDMASGNTLLRNRGDGTFEDTTWAARANPPGWFWGSGFADFDNDGWQDIYSVNGWIYQEKDTEIELEFLNNVVSEMREYKTGAFFDPDHPEHFAGRSWHGWERNRYLRNEGDGTFRELGRATGTDLLLNSRGIAVADFWNRGVLDVAVAASTDRDALLANRLAGRRHWLELELEGAGDRLPAGSNRDAVGARVTVRQGDRRQIREVVLGDGYGSQNSLRLHFGLGDEPRVDELTVRWPRSGRVERFTDVAGDRILRLAEASGELVEAVYPTAEPPAGEPAGELGDGDATGG